MIGNKIQLDLISSWKQILHLLELHNLFLKLLCKENSPCTRSNRCSSSCLNEKGVFVIQGVCDRYLSKYEKRRWTVNILNSGLPA